MRSDLHALAHNTMRPYMHAGINLRRCRDDRCGMDSGGELLFGEE